MVAPLIVWRHIFREITLYTLLALGALSVSVVSVTLLQKLERLLAIGVGPAVVLQLTLALIPSSFLYVIPTAFLFGALLAFTRMSTDGETVAMRASGIGVAGMMPPVLALGALTALACAVVAFDLEPRSASHMKMLMRQLVRQASVIEPGEVNDLGESKTIFVGAVGDESCRLQNIFLSDFANRERPLYIAARCGEVTDAGPGKTELKLSLRQGSIDFADEGSRVGSTYRRIRFDAMETEFDISSGLVRSKRLDHYTMAELLRLDEENSDFPMTTVETEKQRRLALPVGALLLGLLSVPLGLRPARGGRSSGAVTALVVMALYWTLCLTGQVAAEKELASPWIVLWLPNLLVAIAAAFLLHRSTMAEV